MIDRNLGLAFLASFFLVSLMGPPCRSAEVEIPSLSLEQGETISLRLDECIKIGVESATTVLRARNNLEVDGAALLRGYGDFLPNIAAQASYTNTSGNIYLATANPTNVTTSNATAGYGISATLNLFNGVMDYSHLQSLIAKKVSSELTLARVKQSIALDITQSFLTIVLDDRLVAIARKNLQQSQARQKLLLEQTRVGSKNLSDLFRQQAQTSADEALVLTSENKKRADQIALLQKLRLDVSKSYRFVEPELTYEIAHQRKLDERQLLELALQNRKDLRAKNEIAKSTHQELVASRGTYWPRLDLVGSLNAGGTYLYSQTVAGQNVVPTSQTSLFSQLPNQTQFSAGVLLTWNLFDRLHTQQAVATARAADNNAQLDEQDFQNRVRADVRLAFGNYTTARQQLVSSQKGLEAATKAYEVIEGRYEVGAANFIDLVTVQTTLLQAQSARAQAVIDFLLQNKSVDYATGEIAQGTLDF
jgi:outer membrane protein